MPYKLIEEQQQNRVKTCLNLLNRYSTVVILNRIVSLNEEWILHDNQKRLSYWFATREAAKLRVYVPNTNSLCVCGGPIVHYSFLRPVTTITAEV